MLNDPYITTYDIIAIQEPYIGYRGLSRGTRLWTGVFPAEYTKEGAAPTRAAILMNTRLDRNTWRQLDIGDADVTAHPQIVSTESNTTYKKKKETETSQETKT
ncbi:hypothetical protein M422DRAFT_274990 [Sphaerobolus stellatus SS14]|uniref:Endonuclease/exonuclease/phosphatase domain-containing protein n=1 Tax=Sphaerobolus stellatus (strain SS14) TaxID=990650 RepID=A0A0C9T5S2_SPHS4|nr:hypothetical protein M422DRAFT_274990 [Sphaerobolus stellatus SS14]